MKNDGLTRKTHLKSTAAIALPCMIPSSVLESSGRSAPGKKIDIGAVGIGGQRTRHVDGGIWVQGSGFLTKPQVQFVTVCDVNVWNHDNVRNIVNKHHGNSYCASYKDFRQLTARQRIDVVLDATLDNWCVLASIITIKVAMDVYCEKPLSLTIKSAIIALYQFG